MLVWDIPGFVWFVARPGRDWVPDGAVASDIWWGVNPYPVVYTAAKEDAAIGLCMNNAWYAAATVNQVFAVYADETDGPSIHLAQSPLTSAWFGGWPVIHTCTHKGDPLAYPCLALRRQAQEDGVAFALAWRGIGKRLWAAHGSTGSDWEEVDVTALATPPVTDVSRFCIAMDHALNTWLVFSAFDGEHQRIYLAVRPSGGTWSVPTVVSSIDDHTGERETLAFESVDFPSVAISADEDENGPTVLVVYVASYREVANKRVLGKAARVVEVEAAGWSLASVTEVDVGHSAECRDPCVAATRSGTFVVAYSAPTSNANIHIRHTADPVSGTRSDEVVVVGDLGEERSTITRDTQNFASLSMDEATGRCFVCWEDTLYSVTRDAASANGAVAELSDLGTWSALGILTGRELPPEFDPAALPESVVTAWIKEYATRYPCAVATAGSPRLFYTAFNGSHAELVSRVGRWI